MRRAGCCSLSMLLIVLSSCGGSDTPAAPTPTTPTVETPIVVSVTAQIVDTQAIMGTTTIFQERNVRVTGSVSVTGGTATVEAKVTLTPEAGGVPIEMVALTLLC